MISNISNSEFKIQGNHIYLIMMFKILVHNIPKEYKKINCDLVQNKRLSGTLELNFDITLKSSLISDKHRLKIACALLNKMGNFYNMSVLSEFMGDELNTIRIIWEVSEAV